MIYENNKYIIYYEEVDFGVFGIEAVYDKETGKEVILTENEYKELEDELFTYLHEEDETCYDIVDKYPHLKHINDIKKQCKNEY